MKLGKSRELMEGRDRIAGSTSIILLLLKHRNESVTPTATENYSKTSLLQHMGKGSACLDERTD